MNIYDLVIFKEGARMILHLSEGALLCNIISPFFIFGTSSLVPPRYSSFPSHTVVMLQMPDWFQQLDSGSTYISITKNWPAHGCTMLISACTKEGEMKGSAAGTTTGHGRS